MRALRDEARSRGMTGARLCREVLDVRAKDLSCWCDPDGPWRREPPLWAIRRLLDVLELAVVVLPDEVLVVPRSEVAG